MSGQLIINIAFIIILFLQRYSADNSKKSCPNKSEYFSTPLEAFKYGSREKILYIACINLAPNEPDYLAVVDVDPESSEYLKVIHRLHMPDADDELHHFGWNACSSCAKNKQLRRRTHLVLPALHSNHVYLVNVANNLREPFLEKIVDLKEHGVTFPHTVHCLPNGELMISCLGDKDGNALGTFPLIDGKTFKFKGNWSKSHTPFGYDFWYQPRYDVMISTEWGAPNKIKQGFNPADAADGFYGNKLHVWKWSTHEYLYPIDLGEDGTMSLEIRFLHNPDRSHGYVVSALGSSLFHFYKNSSGKWSADRVVKAEPLSVDNWLLPMMPAIFTDFLISMDDRYLYLSAWVHGYIRQYDITDRFHPKLTDQIYIGGSLVNSGPVKVNEDDFIQPDPLIINGRTIDGGPQMLQLSLDGKRLYVTTSLYSYWDKEFYPDLYKNGGVLLQIDIDTKHGGMKLNRNFLVDFGKEPSGPVLPHEMRYPGGDCTSDIWI